MMDVDGTQQKQLAPPVLDTQAKVLVNLQAVDGTPPIANASDVHCTQQKPYVQEILVVHGAPTHVLVVPTSILKEIVKLQLLHVPQDIMYQEALV